MQATTLPGGHSKAATDHDREHERSETAVLRVSVPPWLPCIGWVVQGRQIQPLRRKKVTSAIDTTTISPSTPTYPYCQFSSGMFLKFMP